MVEAGEDGGTDETSAKETIAAAPRRDEDYGYGGDIAVFAALAKLPDHAVPWLLDHLNGRQRGELAARWNLWSQIGQSAPAEPWRVWLIRAGRGFGKTRAGAEWVRRAAWAVPHSRIALVGATAIEVERVMVTGPSGVLNVGRADERPAWRAVKGEVHWPNGSVAHVYSAGAPETLRGPEHHAAWCDELAKWRYGEAAWDNLMLGLRLGDAPRAVVTTTPRPTDLMRKVMAQAGTKETRGRTKDNAYLPAAFVDAMTAQYGGTRLGRQELDGELIDDVEGALWPRDLIERCRLETPLPVLVRVVVGVDPPAGIGGDACGIVAAAVGEDGCGYVLEDASVTGASPEQWARAVAACVARWNADRVIAEKNMGGEMVRATLAAADQTMPITLVSATRGKVARAEPVAALYETGKVRHAAPFPALEDELAGLSTGGAYEGPGRSPDRADALVWALTALMLGKRRAARVRGV